MSCRVSTLLRPAAATPPVPPALPRFCGGGKRGGFGRLRIERRQQLRRWIAAAWHRSARHSCHRRAGNQGAQVRHDRADRLFAHRDCPRKGLFKKYGIESTVSKGASWAAIRDSLSTGDIQATHMLLGMPIASTMGLLGSPKKPMVIPWLLNRNGQAITLKAEWKGKVARRSRGPQAVRGRSKSQGDATDLRDDVSARHARDVDAVLPGRGWHQPR